jgi:hypothetical protein
VYRAWHVLFVMIMRGMKKVAMWLLRRRLKAGADNIDDRDASYMICLRRGWNESVRRILALRWAVFRKSASDAINEKE